MLKKRIYKLVEVLRNTHVKQGAVWSSITVGHRKQSLYTNLQEAPKNVQEPRISQTILQTPQPRSTMPNLRRLKLMPLSQTQKGIWYESKLRPDSVAYKLFLVFKVTGSLDVEKMQKAWSLLVERREALRTTIIEENGQPMQCISPYALNNIEIINRESMEAEKYISENLIKKPFTLGNSPLSRCHLVCCENSQSFLVLDFHHIIMDASSTNVLLKDLNYYYNALVKGEQVIISPEDTTMTQYLETEERYLQGGPLALAKDFWLKSLASVQTTVEIGSRTYNTGNSPHRESNIAHFELQESNKLFDNFSAKGYSMFVTLSAALGITLHRYSGQNSLALGYASLLDRSKLKNLVNCGINILPLPMHFDSDLTVSQLLKNLKTHRREARKFDYYPLNHLLQALRQVDPTVSLNVHISECHVDIDSLNFHGASVENVAVDTHSSVSDLVLYYFPLDNKVRFELKYNSEKFTEEWINQFISSFRLIVQEMSHNSDQSIHKLPIMTQDLQRKLLVDWNQTQINYPLDKTTVSQLFEEQVEKSPDARAVVFKDQVLTYRELHNKSNQLASYLKSLGVSEGSKVSVNLERGPDFIVSLLAILKTGGAFVPLSTKFPAERLAYALRDSEAKLLLTTKAQSKIVESNIPICYLDELKLPSCEDNLLHSSMMNRTDQLAYVIYTSGTTGKPKGVAIEHRALTNFTLWYRDYFKLSPQDNITQYYEISFDASISEIFPTLICGACLHIIQDELRVSLEALNDYYNHENITFSALPTAVFERFQTLPNSSLRALGFGGDKLSQFTNPQNYDVYNLYGPTENTIISTVAHLDCSENIAIGRPIANTKAYVLDKWLQPVPIGAVGELYVSGAGLSRGYLNLPNLTDEKFIQNPFASEEDKKLGTNLTLYKTGDLVYYLPDGRLKYVSRVDSQVKLRGFRIELREIESVLRRETPVKDVAVIIREDSPNDKRLVAYLVHDSKVLSQAEEDTLIQNIQKTLKSHLLDYMIPSAFVFLEKLPLTLSDKVDQKALPKPNYKSSNFIAPSTETEKRAANIWAQVLQIDPATISVTDSFFELGGTSLHVAQVVQLFKQKLNIEISLIDIFTNPTLTGLLSTHSSTQNREIPALMTIQPEGKRPPLFLFHPIDGLSYFYAPLKDVIPDQPIYGVNNPYFASDKFFRSFKEMVQHYLQLVKKTSKGPYQLGGWSLGGFLALEIASELKKQGERVENVILLDILNFNKMPKGNWKDDTPYELNVPDYDKEWYGNILDALHIEKQSEFYNSLSKTLYRTNKMLKKYEMSSYDGRVVLLKARSLSEKYGDSNFRAECEKLVVDPLAGFEELLPNLEVMSVPGDHLTMLTHQNLPEFKRILSKALTQPSLTKQYPDHDLLARNFLLALKENDEHQIKLLQKDKRLSHQFNSDKVKDLL